MPQSEQVSVQCRLAEGELGFGTFGACAFQFPRCDGCPNISRRAPTMWTAEDPMISVVLDGWLHGELHAPG